MPSPALLIFDCDGVLIDSERLAHEVLRQMLAEPGVVLTLQQAFDRFMGASTDKLLATLHDLLESREAAFAVALEEVGGRRTVLPPLGRIAGPAALGRTARIAAMSRMAAPAAVTGRRAPAR
jgi:beta-phosphoglucomutase-like phosphatase (HAD superfamily)